MTPADPLRRTVSHTHHTLGALLAGASAGVATPGQPRKAYEAIDTFLAVASRHLAAVDAVLLPVTRTRLTGGSELVQRYLRTARHLEVVLAHVKARAYGSVFETGFHWDDVWGDVRAALADHRAAETELADQLSTALPLPELDRVTERLHASEATAPTRPHPYAPHTGLPGLIARKVLHGVDAFWDTAEGRMLPRPERPRRRRPGLLAQYLLGDPRFDPDTPRRG